MEKSSVVKPKNRLLKLAASAVTFQNPPFSPSKEKRSSDHATHKIRKGFSGPMISIIPAEARYKSRTSSFAAYEPTSPKISCMGQIKHKKKMCSLNKQNHKSLPPRDHPFISHSTPLEQLNHSKKPKVLKSTQSFTQVQKTNQRVLKSVQSFNEEKKKKSFVIRNIFARPPAVKKGDHSVDRAPSLGQMQRFSSGRNSLSNFDWTAVQIAPVETDRKYHSDEERSESDREEEEDDCKIAFSAPILIGGCKEVELEPRKEINLWKRRTMAQPKPLQLNSLSW